MAIMMLALKPLAGSHVDCAIDDAIRLAQELGVGINFSFNGVKLTVFSGSNRNELSAEYERRLVNARSFPSEAETKDFAVRYVFVKVDAPPEGASVITGYTSAELMHNFTHGDDVVVLRKCDFDKLMS